METYDQIPTPTFDIDIWLFTFNLFLFLSSICRLLSPP